MIENLLKDIRACRHCEQFLTLGARPVLTASKNSRIIIIGQAPGLAVHNSGIPWDDKSGDNLRNWMGIDKDTFYNTDLISIIPMGFCYPGKGKTGDLPPRKECAPLWHDSLMKELEKVQLVILVGKYAQDYYLKKGAKKNLTENVRQFEEFLPEYFVLPHPSPRNNIWQAKNEWFKFEVLPELELVVSQILK